VRRPHPKVLSGPWLQAQVDYGSNFATCFENAYGHSGQQGAAACNNGGSAGQHSLRLQQDGCRSQSDDAWSCPSRKRDDSFTGSRGNYQRRSAPRCGALWSSSVYPKTRSNIPHDVLKVALNGTALQCSAKLISHHQFRAGVG